MAVRVAFVLCIAAGSSAGMPAAAQVAPAALPAMFDLSRAPDRPQLVYRAGGTALPPDTNDANAYYAAGVASLSVDPAGASAAFYWASRLNPAWAEPYFARWYALVREARTRRWQRTLRERLGPALPDTVQRQVDSLVVLAALHNPFFDERIQSADIANQMRNGAELRRERVKEDNIVREEEGRLPLLMPRSTTVSHSWYLAYAERHFDSASADLASLIAKYPDALPLYVYRSKAQYYLGQYDSAAATFRAAINQVDRHDSEARIAAEIRPEDPVVQLFLGYTLLSTHRPADAIEHFRAATVADPYFALPYYYTGQANELAHDTSAALIAYHDFLSRASRADNLRGSAEEALAVLGGPVK